MSRQLRPSAWKDPNPPSSSTHLILACGVLSWAAFILYFSHKLYTTWQSIAVPPVVAVEPVVDWYHVGVDIGLLCMFSVQHTVMASDQFKNFVSESVSASSYRIVYSLVSLACLILCDLMWQANNHAIWRIHWPGAVLMCQALFVLFVCFTAYSLYAHDHFELVGLRQAMCSFGGFQQPSQNWSHSLKRFYRHSRHPVFRGPIFAMLATPCLTVDRFLVIGWFIVYMHMCTKLDEEDLRYYDDHMLQEQYDMCKMKRK
eukprot:CFRG4744T1